MIDKKDMLTITQAANKIHITRMGIFLAIHKRGLKATRCGQKWYIHVNDFNGEPLFDIEKGYYSVNHLSKLLGKDVQTIYYLIRMGKIDAMKKGGAIVIKREEVERLYAKDLDRKEKMRKHA
jgi:excisionase family DNA binding protein